MKPKTIKLIDKCLATQLTFSEFYKIGTYKQYCKLS